MQTYQTLSLIGCVIGMLLMFLGMALGALIVGLSSTAPAGTTEGASFIGLALLSLILYGIMLIMTFVLKPQHSKILGIILLVLGFIAVLTSLIWGIVAYVILIPAAILAIRYKHTPTNNNSDKGGIVAGSSSGGGERI